MPEPATTIGVTIGTALAAALLALRKHLKRPKRGDPPSSPRPAAPPALPPNLIADLTDLARRMQNLERQSIHWITDEEFGVAQRENNETIRRMTAEVSRALGRLESWMEIRDREQRDERAALRQSQPGDKS